MEHFARRCMVVASTFFAFLLCILSTLYLVPPVSCSLDGYLLLSCYPLTLLILVRPPSDHLSPGVSLSLLLVELNVYRIGLLL